jgi:hypothetical protein
MLEPTSLAGMPAVQLTGPSPVGYAGVIVGWGEAGDVLLFVLTAATKDAFRRAAPTWKKAARTASWDQARFRDHAKFRAEGEIEYAAS